MHNEVFIEIIVFVFGLIFGSFYNVVGYRLPNKLSIAFPPSHCVNCNHKLRFYELIPVISYVFLKGKCKECKNKISIIYPLFELTTGVLFLMSYMVFGISINFFISITFISVLIIITISDIRNYIIPDEILVVGGILIVLELIINSLMNDMNIIKDVAIPILNGAGAFAILYLFKVLGDVLFKKESLGGGDIKLMFVIGLVLGFDMSMVVIFMAAFIALPLSVYALAKNNKNVLPFGPYLSIASIIVLLTKLDLNTILIFLTK